MQTLQRVLEPILPEPSTSELLKVLRTSTIVQNLLRDDQDGFYAVVVSAPADSGIPSRDSAINSESTFSWPKWERFDTFHEALVYMVAKGVEERLPPIIPAVEDTLIKFTARALSRCSDNTGLNPPKARYDQFLRIIRQWRHLKMLKRSGQGHDPTGILNTKAGECAVLCLACPQPGKNIIVSSSVRDVDALFVALDANFRLRHRAVSSDENDPSLSRGWSYFVEETAFKTYLQDHKNDVQEKSNCSNHSAVNMADVKTKKGCDATGVGMVVCARHGMRLPNGVADLQYGERYVNMDYAFALALHHSSATVLKVSYDIACQWHKKLRQRMDKMPPHLQLNLQDRDIAFLVPKFHLPAHVTSCQWSFSFNWTKGVGRTDGEEPERGWANLNAAASSTKEMGPGHCPSILKKIKEAIPEHNDHQQDFEELTRSLMLKFPLQLALWKQQVEEWESDSTKPNPFEVKNDGITLASVCLQLAKDEAMLSAGESEPPLHPDVTPSIFISTGIDLEEHQQCLHEAMGLCTTDTQQTRFQQCSNMLMWHIEAWQQIQVFFMPGFKDRFLRGQGANTRARNCLKTVDAKINTAATRYHVAYQVLCTLGLFLGQVSWRDELHPLADEDICGLTSGYDLRPGEGRRQVSWIWQVCGYSEQATENESDDGFQEAIRVEWCKARARAHRWQEEVKLLFEEMQWTLLFLEWHAKWWMERIGAVATTDEALSEGHRAYTECQAELWHWIGGSFAHMWRNMQLLLDVANTDSVSLP
ncbi:hypothetical protein SCLCIDRAFT_24966 [Scleroderma citrinum Foug A]|uniref:CxC2-like cysteine cluster KDZ transposase-associated domain-containing protein n=1 Tax=Scleroderma citrinum Foug A TaxID=1036808 RepID=A0A0C3E1N6_9AGAM|nr:hypothetical protein SCLCIDRAFT_24966 [Scleroderma citrinum Foug A]